MKRNVYACLLGFAAFTSTAEALAQGADPAEDAESTDETSVLESRVIELEAQLRTLSDRIADDELQKIIEKAELAALAPAEEKRPEDRVFHERGRSLQMANPEISVSGDFLAELAINDALFDGRPEGSGMPIRAMGITFQSVLDPYSITKVALEFFPDLEEPANLEECFIQWFGLVPSTSLTLGRFRQQFGVANRWHEHDLDQTYYPEAVFLLGEYGMLGNGASVKWFMPRLWAHAQELTVDVVDGANPSIFSGEHYFAPSGMAHLKNYWDLSEATYLELGLSGSAGWNNPAASTESAADAWARGADPYATDYSPVVIDPGWGRTAIAGADLTVSWSPPERARYKSVTWRSEGFLVRKETADEGWSQGVGAYSYLQTAAGPKWFLGLRGDWVRPIPDDFANHEGAFARDDLWRAVPYATFWQSEFVYLRLEYWYTLGLDDAVEHRALVQIDWAAGPHKHEKY